MNAGMSAIGTKRTFKSLRGASALDHKRTSRFTAPMSAYDPKRTTQLLWCGSLRGYEALSYLGEAE
jgi:hypothetical protein